MFDLLFALSPARVYLLGVLLMAARTFWRTRARRCDCCDAIRKPYVVQFEDGRTCDLRYVLMFLIGVFWPLAVMIMIASRLLALFQPDDDDARSA